MCPLRKAETLSERYDISLRYMRNDCLPQDAPRPLPTSHWPPENVELLERYRDWMLEGGTSELVTNLYHVMMAGHVFGLTLKPYQQLDPDRDLECALEYVKAKKLSANWIKNCSNSLVHFRRFLRLERGLGEDVTRKPFEIAAHTTGLPGWLVSELERYQRVKQRDWRTARFEVRIRTFWSKNLSVWRFLCQERGVQQFADVKRQFVLDYVDQRLNTGHSVSGVNCDLRHFHGFLLFLQDEGYSVPQSLLRVPCLKQPDALPKYLTDEQVKSLRDEFEKGVAQAQLPSHRRAALMDRATFYLLWHGGLRVGEVEELRLEDLDFPGKKLTVRSGKGAQDRSIYLTDTLLGALSEYLAVRGKGICDTVPMNLGGHVFLYRNAPLGPSLIHSRLKTAGKRVGVRVNPHRLRHTCATQLLNAGCRITSIQRILGHKRLNTTMIYARAYSQTVADDYFSAMRRVEQRLDIGSTPEQVSARDAIDQELQALQKRAANPRLNFFQTLGVIARREQLLKQRAALMPKSEGGPFVAMAYQG